MITSVEGYEAYKIMAEKFRVAIQDLQKKLYKNKGIGILDKSKIHGMQAAHKDLVKDIAIYEASHAPTEKVQNDVR